MITDAPVVSRRERALITPAEANRCAFGPFCRDIDRLRCLTPTQIQVARLLALATLKEGFNSIAFTSLSELMHLSSGRAYRGLGANDLSPAVKGWTKVLPNGEERAMRGLMHFGIVQVDERARLESAMPITVWLVIADSAQWLGVPADGWASSPAEDVEWLESVRACRRRHTPPLDGLGADADLHDARATLGPAVAASDAPELRTMRTERHPMGGHSETQNAYFSEKKECVPKVGMVSIQVGKEVGKGIGKTIQNGILQIGKVDSRVRSERLKAAIQGDERQFMWALREMIGHCRDGLRWRLRHREGGEHRETARRVFADILTSDRATTLTVAARAEDTWQQFGGRSLDAARFQKKSRNLLYAQC